MAAHVSDLWAKKMVDDYHEGYNTRGGSTTEAYLCDWEDRIAYKNLVLGAAHSDAARYPDWQCSAVGIEPVGWAEGETHPDQAKLVVTYASASGGGTSEEPARTSDWSKWRERWEGGGEAISVGRGFRWLTAPTDSIEKAGVSAVKIVPQATVTLTGQTGLGSTAKTAITDTLGKINNGAITIKGKSYSAGHLLFLGADLNEVDGSDASARPYYDVTLKLAAVFDHTWNEFWRDDPAFCKANSPQWDEIVGVSDATKSVYEETDFGDLNPNTW